MQAISIIIFLSLLSLKGISQQKILLEPSSVNFTIRNAGLNVNGTLGGLDGSITVDGQNMRITNIEGSIDPNTIQTGIELRDNHLKKGDYFNVKEFPKILMVSTDIKSKGDNRYIGNFDLTIKGSKKNVTIPFSFTRIGKEFVLKGEFSLNRLDFSLGEESIVLSDQVKVKIEIKIREEQIATSNR